MLEQGGTFPRVPAPSRPGRAGQPLGRLLEFDRELLLELLAAQPGGGDEAGLVLAVWRDRRGLGDFVVREAQRHVRRRVRLPNKASLPPRLVDAEQLAPKRAAC